MKWLPLSLTDDQLIARVRRQHQQRRRSGLLAIVLGAALVALSVVVAWDLKARLQATGDQIISTMSDAKQAEIALKAAAAEWRFTLGLAVGALLSGKLIIGSIMAFEGLNLLYGRDRKTELLLWYLDADPARSPPAPQ